MMRCVDWTPEYLDGHVAVALLRAHDIDAHLFDENLVRQHWFHIIAYGGFRIMAPSAQLLFAGQVMKAYREGEFQLADDIVDTPECPRCRSACCEADPRPRRGVFLAYLAWTLVWSLLMLVDALPDAAIIFAWVVPACVMLMPPLLRWFIVGRYRCTRCGQAWRAPPSLPFSKLQLRAQ